MENTELKIGDWVYYHSNPVKINSFKGEMLEILVGFGTADYHFEDCKIGHVRPIPLTKEILEKNEWKSQKAPYKMYLQYRKKGNPTLDEWGDGFYFSYGNKMANIKYVHQLQHLLWALGIDDNLKV